LAVTGDAFVTSAMPIDDIDGKCHKTELKSSRNHLTNQVKITPLGFYGYGGVHARIDTYTNTFPHESDFRGS